MRSAYVNPTPHEEARHAFAFGMSAAAAQGRGIQRRRSTKSDVQMLVEAPPPSGGCCPPPKCPGSPKCLTSFPKDWLWTAAPATPQGKQGGHGSWPGDGKGGQSIRLGGDLFGA